MRAALSDGQGIARPSRQAEEAIGLTRAGVLADHTRWFSTARNGAVWSITRSTAKSSWPERGRRPPCTRTASYSSRCDRLPSSSPDGFPSAPFGDRVVVMAADKVHRDLRLTTPVTEGPDVKALQQALNKTARQLHRILEFELLEDGRLGEKTLQATVKTAHVMGLFRRGLNRIEKEHVVEQPVQRMLRDPRRRNEAQRKRAAQRRARLRKRLDKRLSLKG